MPDRSTMGFGGFGLRLFLWPQAQWIAAGSKGDNRQRQLESELREKREHCCSRPQRGVASCLPDRGRPRQTEAHDLLAAK